MTHKPSFKLMPAVLKAYGITEKPKYEHVFAPPRKWRFDIAFPEARIACEVDGGVYTRGRHVRPYGFMSDMDKMNTAALEGWLVVRIDRIRAEAGVIYVLLAKAFQARNEGR